MPKKNVSIITPLLLIGLMLAACTKATPDKTDCTREEIFCVGLVTDLEGITDQSVNQMAWQGVLQAQADKVADQVKYIETVDAKDYANNISILAEAGYDVIVTAGNNYAEATISAARSHPDRLFIGVEQQQSQFLPNLVGLVFHDDQLGFLAGALAAQVTKTNLIAVVLDAEMAPAAVALKEGFEAGAKYINTEIGIISAYYPGEGETTSMEARWGASATAEAVQNGADVVFAAGSKVGKGVLLEAAKHPGIYCIGANDDLWNIYREAAPCLISSAVKQINAGVYQLVKMAREGAFPSGNYFGTPGMGPYHDFESLVPPPVKERMSAIITGLEEGTLSTNVANP